MTAERSYTSAALQMAVDEYTAASGPMLASVDRELPEMVRLIALQPDAQQILDALVGREETKYSKRARYNEALQIVQQISDECGLRFEPEALNLEKYQAKRTRAQYGVPVSGVETPRPPA